MLQNHSFMTSQHQLALVSTNSSHVDATDVHVGDVEVLQPLQAEEALVGEAADGVVGQGQPPQPGHKNGQHFEQCSPISTLIPLTNVSKWLNK